MRVRTTVEEERGRRGHDSQVSSDGDRGVNRGDDQGESDDARKGWSARIKRD